MDTKYKILDSARVLFNEYGYWNVTSRMIAIELEIKSFYDGLRERYVLNKKNDGSSKKMKLRTYSFSAISYPSMLEAQP